MRDSIWQLTLSEAQREALEAGDPLPRTADVAIVGAGLIGLAIAYYLRRAGVTGVCVVDASGPVAEASGANAGGLWLARECSHLGPLLPLARASGALYDALAAEMAFDLKRAGLLELFPSGGAVEGAAATARAAGFPVEEVGEDEIRELEPALGREFEGAVLYPEDGQLNPVKLGAELAGRLRRSGVKICPGVEVARAGTRMETTKGRLTAGVVVIACGAWTPLVTRTLGWTPPIKPMRGQLLAVGPLPPMLGRTVIGPEYYYWQLREGFVCGGGTTEDVGFRRGVEAGDVARIRAEMGALFPGLAKEEVVRAWSGFRPFCEDGLPVVGRVPGYDSIYVAAGHFRKGVMLAPVTGKIVADLIRAGRTELPIEALRAERQGRSVC
ncbi:MAG: FAD-binding oxidoreductase [Bryobacteraceae bacterium]|nr:FAD-binding oxidoreductase [Bryobacteraceae bacterium]